MKKYVVINCYNREFCKVGVAVNLKEASEMLKNDFLNVLLDNGYTEEDFENNVGLFDKWELSTTYAWLNGRNCNYDWTIFVVD